MGHRTAEEALADDQRVLGAQYGKAFHHALQELWRVSANWDRYETLYGSQEAVDILNKSSGLFSHVLQNMLFEHVLLGLCRLTDAPQMRGRTNLSIDALLLLDPTRHKIGLNRRIRAAKLKCAFARSWRDKHIGHNDFEQITGQVNLLAPATRRKVSKAILAIHEVFRWIHARYFKGNLGLSSIGDDDANQILRDLARAQAFRQMERKELEKGNFTPLTDWESKLPAKAADWNQRYSSRLKLPKPYRGKLPLAT